MRTNQIFMKNLAPPITARGYICEHVDRNYYEFKNDQKSIIITCRIPRHGMIQLIDGWNYIGSCNCVEAWLCVRCGYAWEQLRLSQLNYFNEPVADKLRYDNSEDLCNDLNTFARQILIALDHLERIVDGLIAPDVRYYMFLAANAQSQAEDFAQKHHLDFYFSLKNVMYVENLLKERFSTYRAAVSRKAAFEEDLGNLIPLCAYYGELFRQKSNGKWVDCRGTKLDMHMRGVYGVLWDTEYGDYNGLDPIAQIITFLNFGPEKTNPVLIRSKDLE